MNRKELYQHIQNLHLQDEIKEVTGKNYTVVPNELLAQIVGEALLGMEEDEVSDAWPNFCALVEILHKKRVLLKSEVDTIMNA